MAVATFKHARRYSIKNLALIDFSSIQTDAVSCGRLQWMAAAHHHMTFDDHFISAHTDTVDTFKRCQPQWMASPRMRY